VRTAALPRRGDNRLILGIVLAVVTFWLFAQTTLNVAPAMREDLRIAESVNNIAVSITALFSGIFIVIAGGLADTLRTFSSGIVVSVALLCTAVLCERLIGRRKLGIIGAKSEPGQG